MTFYKVTYGVWGADKPRTRYFDSKEAAYDFYNSRDHIDKPVAIVVHKPDAVQKYLDLIAEYLDLVDEGWEV